ncbi:LPS-assembly protein LptD [Dysgonomonas sp. Marseille-P4677]|uniref:putative LPS assembly protein LptD n=1 Tax=Dysgonomonas sp. Marseille-P4677 TaxID=2364790 RepID=UPI001914CD29|nr:putative LPS assembly protein LptD [Dysgonomonas sp. Marseille-P4677]MBK5719333.1 LPS-assembly protein LptD [Dysgonomonas sp. Marseille-P4677]
MRKIRILTYVFLCILFSVPFLGAQYSYTRQSALNLLSFYDTLPFSGNDSLRDKNDSLRLNQDSLPSDSLAKKKDPLDAVVDYVANDSIVLTADNWGYLYGDSEVKYTDITLKGEQIFMNIDSSLVYAKFGLDSVGKEFGYPVFSDGGTDYESKTMKYNFKSKKGYSTNIITTQGEGYVVAGRAKKQEDNSFFMLEGKYTTCDDHEHPHFYLALTKAKVKPKKNVVTGPAYLVIEGLPIPIGLPFGFFPFSEKYSSGVIMPSYGDELDRGFNLRDGGYYFAINDNVDLALTGDIYTKGSWGLKARSTYRYRYKHSGSFDFNYLVNKYGEKGIDFSQSKDLAINWTHSQDPKSNMFRTLSASVNFSTSSYNQNSLDQKYVPRGTSNTKSSSVNLTQRIPNSAWSLSASVNVAQRSSDSSISLTLPNLTVTMSRIAPFKRKEAVGSERWYEKIQLSYTGDFRNSIDTKENLLFKSGIKQWKNGMQHTIPISATFSALNYLNITPSINYRERWYTNKIYERWDPVTKSHVSIKEDSVYSFNRVYDFNFNLGFQTKMYGEYIPIFSKETRIRHVFTPSVTFSYTPDFSNPRFGFYERYHYIDANGRDDEHIYSPYSKGMFGTAPKGAAGMITFSFENNLEMKTPSQSDSTGFKKRSLIDNLGINFSHNMMADSLKWSDIAVSARFKLSKSLVVNIGAAFDPYLYREDNNGTVKQVNELRISHGKGFGRLKSTGYSISPSINQDTFKKWFGKEDDNSSKKSSNNNSSDDYDADIIQEDGNKERGSLLEQKKDDNQYDDDGYVKNEIQWNLSFNFSMNYSWDRSRWTPKSGGYVEYKGQLTKNFGLSGGIQPTKNWNFNFNASYDFDTKKIAYMSCNLTRNLHCWSISASFNPVGQYKSYYVSLRANSSMLQDLKKEWRGRNTGYDPNWD